MNNVGFVLLRHLRDLGFDAHLLLYKDDGVGHSSHFVLDSDSWDSKKWSKYIHQLPIANSYGSALTQYFIIRVILYFAFIFRKLIKADNAHLTKPATKMQLIEFKKILSRFDKYLGSGSSPAIFQANGLTLDIFFNELPNNSFKVVFPQLPVIAIIFVFIFCL